MRLVDLTDKFWSITGQGLSGRQQIAHVGVALAFRCALVLEVTFPENLDFRTS